MSQTSTDPRYPIGQFELSTPDPDTTRSEIDSIAATPDALRRAVIDLSDQQLDTPYREGGWTIRQVANHIPDSHINAYVRVRLALTESDPSIKTYDEKGWANLVDAKTGPIEPSLRLLEALHERWVALLRSLSVEEFSRTMRHPDLGQLRVDQVICLYGWHGRHHVAHITEKRRLMGW